MTQPELGQLTRFELMEGEDEQETALLGRMREEAAAFIRSFAWCESVREEYFGLGVGGVAAVFLLRIVPKSEEVQEWLWVVVGDVPSAYLVTDACADARSALLAYIGEVEAWVSAVEEGRPIDGLMAVNAPATAESATALRSRMEFLRREVLPVAD